jgi:hypothetical protein
MNRTNIKILRSQGGNAVVAILASIIVLGAFLQTTGFGGIIENNQVFATARAREGRNAVAYQINRYASLPLTFRNSLTSENNGNSDLRNCVLGATPAVCKNNFAYPIRLFSTSSGKPVVMSGAGASGVNQPVYYDLRGNPCSDKFTAASAMCPFEVLTTFTATCPGGVSPCTSADSITVQYSVQTPFYSLAGASGRMSLGDVSKDAATVSVADIMPHAHGYIPGHVIAGSTVGQDDSSSKSPGAIYTKMYNSVLTIVNDPSLAEKITRMTVIENKIDRQDLIDAIATLWLKHPEVAQSVIYPVWEHMQANDSSFSPDNIVRIGIAAAGDDPGYGSAIDPDIGIWLARSGIQDPALAQRITTAIQASGVTDSNILHSVADALITDPAMIRSLNSVREDLGFSNAEQIWPVADFAAKNNISDKQQLEDYGKTLVYTPHDPDPVPVASNPSGPGTGPSTGPIIGTPVATCETSSMCATVPGL